MNALVTWRVAELKRRLVYLKIFSDAGKISIKPRYEDDELADHQALGSLDTDVTYEARSVLVA